MPTLSNATTVMDAIQNEMRIPTSNLTERTKMTQVVTGVYSDMCAKQDWWWLQQQAIRNTTPKITAGTVSVTENSASITFSTAPQQFSANVSVAGFVITLPGNTVDNQSVFRISAHTSGALAATLDAAYTGGTDTAASYRCYQLSYNVPTDCAKLLFVKRYGRQEPLERMGIEDLSYLQMNSLQEGKPQAYSIFDFTTVNDPTSKRLLQIWPYPDQAYRMELWYKHAGSADISTDLFLPIHYQQVLIYGGLARCYPIFLNDTERGTFYQGLFNDMMALMAAQQREYASDHPGVATDMRGYRTMPTRGHGRHASLGNYFDILPNVP